MTTPYSRKAINFDLDTKKLKQFYPCKGLLSYKKAYKDIKKFMENNGFEHRQWSGYISKQNIDSYDVSVIIAKLSYKFPWLKQCVNKFDVTDIGNQYDLTDIIDKPNKILEKTKTHNSLDEKLKTAKSNTIEHNKDLHIKKQINKNNNLEL